MRRLTGVVAVADGSPGPSAVEAGIGAEPSKRAKPGVVERRGSPTLTSSSATERVESPRSRSSVLGLALTSRASSRRPLVVGVQAGDLLAECEAAAAAARARDRRGALAGARARPAVGARRCRSCSRSSSAARSTVRRPRREVLAPVESERRRRCQSINCPRSGSGPAGSPMRLNAFGSNECASTSRAIRSASSVSDLPRWRARSARSARSQTSRTSWPRPVKNMAVCRPQPAAFSIPERAIGPNDAPTRPVPVPLNRDPETLARQQPAARVEHAAETAACAGRCDQIARMIGRQQQMRGPRPCARQQPSRAPFSPIRRYCL